MLFVFSSSSVTAANSATFDPPALLKVLNKDFPLFKDSDEQVIYIDFELIITNIKSLRISSHEGELVFQDDVSDKKVDAIYEIDYSSLKSGTYRLELFAFSGAVLSSEFLIK